MPQRIDQSGTFCFDCVYMYYTKINPCSHTVCDACLHAAVAEKIRLKQETFICPRCTDSEERRNRLGKIVEQNRLREQRKVAPIVLSKQLSPLQHECRRQKNETNVVNHQHSIHRTLEVVSDSFWPDGIESWHVYEIKPQRESFAEKDRREKLSIQQQFERQQDHDRLEQQLEFERERLREEQLRHAIVFDNQHSKHDLDLKQNQLASRMEVVQVKEESSTHLHVVVDTCDQLQESRSTPDMPRMSRPLKRPQHRYEPKRNGRIHISGLPSRNSSNVQPSDRSRNQVLPLMGTYFAVLSLFLLAALMRIGIVHCPAPGLDCSEGQALAFGWIFLVGTFSAIRSKQRLNNSTTFVKTIEKLRNLESLLIYAIA